MTSELRSVRGKSSVLADFELFKALTFIPSGTRNGRYYDDDIVFQREAPRARTPPRLRSPSPPPARDERIEIRQRWAIRTSLTVP